MENDSAELELRLAAIEQRLAKNDESLKKEDQLLAVASSDNRGDLYELGVDNDPATKHQFESYNVRAQGEIKAMREAFGQFTGGHHGRDTRRSRAVSAVAPDDAGCQGPVRRDPRRQARQAVGVPRG